MSFFKGYVPTKNKRPLQPFKDAPLCTLDEVQSAPEYAGVLAHDTVLIDVDDRAQAEALLNIVDAMGLRCMVRKTDRGMHFYFKNTSGAFTTCGAGLLLSLGLKCDIKVGTKASIAILKSKGVERPVVYDVLEGEQYQDAPTWLRVVHSNIALFGLHIGEGRNSDLFRFILPLLKAGLSIDDCKTCVRLINQYVLKEPLGERELSTILRPEAFNVDIVPEFFGERGKFLFNVFGDHLISTLHIKRINGQLHMYEGGAYVDGLKRIEHAMLGLIPDLNQAKRGEVLSYLDVMCSENVEAAPANYIAFKNGILDINTGELLPFSPDIVITNKIEFDYRADAACPLVDTTLDKLACGDAAIRALLEEMAGYCFYRRNELRKAFILVGDKANGKSTFIAMLQTMVGDSNCASLDLKELSERFKTAELFRKLVNLGDDIDDEFISNTAIFKKLVSGDRLSAERKGQDPFEFSNYSKFVFSANVLPRVKDKTGAMLDRLVVIPFNAHFSKSDPDYRPFIKYELCQKDAIEYLIKLGVDALKRVLARRSFSQSDQVDVQLEEYNELNNPLLLFTKEVNIGQFCTECVGYWWEQYHQFCLANGIQTLGRIEFARQVLRALPALCIKRKRVGGMVQKVFALK